MSKPKKRRTAPLTEQEQRGLAAAKAFLELCNASRENRAPSPDAVALISKGFETWMTSWGKLDLEKVFGFSGSPGRDSLLRSMAAALRDQWYQDSMSVLVGAGFTIEQAADAIADHDKRNPQHLANFHEEPRTADTIRDTFQRLGGEKWARENGYYGDDDSIPPGHEPHTIGEQRRQFIKRLLSPHLIPAKIKDMAGSRK